jgi:hypothetical protein
MAVEAVGGFFTSTSLGMVHRKTSSYFVSLKYFFSKKGQVKVDKNRMFFRGEINPKQSRNGSRFLHYFRFSNSSG